MDEKKGGGDEAFKAGQHALAVELYGECLQLLRDAVRDTDTATATATAGAVTTRVMVLCSQGQGQKTLSSKIYLNRATARSKLTAGQGQSQSQLEEAVRDCNAALAINAGYLKVTAAPPPTSTLPER